MYGVNPAAIFHIKVQFFERKGILIRKVGSENFGPEKEEVLKKVQEQAQASIDYGYGNQDGYPHCYKLHGQRGHRKYYRSAWASFDR
jgi:hypothetical protein